jgi:hypothetical protein
VQKPVAVFVDILGNMVHTVWFDGAKISKVEGEIIILTFDFTNFAKH